MIATTLKIIGIISMTVDHIGYFLFPQKIFFRIIGRFAFPIFVYLIAEGCCYTKNRLRYCSVMFVTACVCFVAEYIAEKSLYQSVFTTFFCAVILIFSLSNAIKATKTAYRVLWSVLTAGLICLYFCAFQLKRIPGFETDYGFFGIMTPVFVYLGRSKVERLVLFTIALFIVSVQFGAIQYFSLADVIILWFYNGKCGKYSMKWFFYAFYPLHLAVLYLISQLVL